MERLQCCTCAVLLGHISAVSRWRSIALVQHRHIGAVQHRVSTVAASHCLRSFPGSLWHSVTLAQRCIGAASHCCSAASRWNACSVALRSLPGSSWRSVALAQCCIGAALHWCSIVWWLAVAAQRDGAALQPPLMRRVGAALQHRIVQHHGFAASLAMAQRRDGTASCCRSIAASCWHSVAASRCCSVLLCGGGSVQRSSMVWAHHHVDAASRWNSCSVAFAQLYQVTVAQHCIRAATHCCQCSVAAALQHHIGASQHGGITLVQRGSYMLVQHYSCASLRCRVGATSRWHSVASPGPSRGGGMARHCSFALMQHWQHRVGAVLQCRVAVSRRAVLRWRGGQCRGVMLVQRSSAGLCGTAEHHPTEDVGATALLQELKKEDESKRKRRRI